MSLAYRIEVAHYDLKIPLIDEFIFGKNASHSFLRLVDSSDNVIEEIHGGAFDFKQNQMTAYRFKLGDIFNRKAKVSTLSNEYGLRTEIRTTPTDSGKIDHCDAVASAGQVQIMRMWDKAKTEAQAINEKNLRYIAMRGMQRAQNCHSVVNTLCETMGVPYAPCHTSHPFALPGVATCLKAEVIAHSSKLKDRASRFLTAFTRTPNQTPNSGPRH